MIKSIRHEKKIFFFQSDMIIYHHVWRYMKSLLYDHIWSNSIFDHIRTNMIIHEIFKFNIWPYMAIHYHTRKIPPEYSGGIFLIGSYMII